MDSFLPVFYELLKVFGVKQPSEGIIMQSLSIYRFTISFCDVYRVWFSNGVYHSFLHYEDSSA